MLAHCDAMDLGICDLQVTRCCTKYLWCSGVVVLTAVAQCTSGAAGLYGVARLVTHQDLRPRTTPLELHGSCGQWASSYCHLSVRRLALGGLGPWATTATSLPWPSARHLGRVDITYLLFPSLNTSRLLVLLLSPLLLLFLTRRLASPYQPFAQAAQTRTPDRQFSIRAPFSFCCVAGVTRRNRRHGVQNRNHALEPGA